MRRIGISVACVALALAFGCDNRDPDIMLMDGGPGGTDSGPGTGDSGPSTTPDAGPSCPPQMASMPTMPMACEASTLTCLMSASTQAAQMACIDADANPDACDTCINQDVFYSCTNGGGCDDEFGLVNCCIADECGASPTMDCANTALMGACSSTYNTFGMCLNTAQMAMACGVSATTCFQSGSGFLPDFDRHTVQLRGDFRAWLLSQIVRDGIQR